MTNGLKLIQVPGSYYGWSATLVGWFRRVNGDEWELLPGARSIIRTGGYRNMASLAAEGPKRDHTISEPSETKELVHRLLIRRALEVNEDVWLKHCPKPKDWAD